LIDSTNWYSISLQKTHRVGTESFGKMKNVKNQKHKIEL